MFKWTLIPAIFLFFIFIVSSCSATKEEYQVEDFTIRQNIQYGPWFWSELVVNSDLSVVFADGRKGLYKGQIGAQDLKELKKLLVQKWFVEWEPKGVFTHTDPTVYSFSIQAEKLKIKKSFTVPVGEKKTNSTWPAKLDKTIQLTEAIINKVTQGKPALLYTIYLTDFKTKDGQAQVKVTLENSGTENSQINLENLQVFFWDQKSFTNDYLHSKELPDQLSLKAGEKVTYVFIGPMKADADYRTIYSKNYSEIVSIVSSDKIYLSLEAYLTL